MSQPFRDESVIELRPSTQAPAKRPVTAGKLALVTGGGVLALAALGGAAIALFNVALTTVTLGAFLVAILAVIFLMPALILALNAGRVRAKEGVARAMPLETLIVQRKQFEQLIGVKAQQLQEANGHLEDFRRLIESNRADMDAADIARWEGDLQVSRDAFARAQTHLTDLRADLAEFDRQIKKARIDTQLAQAKGNVATALQQAKLSAEDRHVTESALSEIARRAGRNAALLDQALAAGEESRTKRGAGA
ncbi:hypothetical protein [Deinococcus multiflagellatus]|uniref:Uncharacterized protein n=1 Tax=Deinococcus multiflagellatus TaxID=1656887 RepID=A0ABW1ZLI2_9DEIO|nr:hypothetical protein [Deinococcus multiflagellatus]MBZ9713381.1 hypothetical protein [Deinococcus multiflagellatus]